MFRSRWSLVCTFFGIVSCANDSAPPPQTPATPPTPGVAPPTTPTSISPDDCRAQGGDVVFDRGDGSLAAVGCPDGRALIAPVRGGIEGGLCCAISSSPTSPAPDAVPSAKRAPCTFGADQTCNEDPKVSALWGRCTELGVCECKPGFELSPQSKLCRPAQ